MKPTRRRRFLPAAALLVLLVTPACSLLADEFTWLDRLPPAPEAAAASGTAARP